MASGIKIGRTVFGHYRVAYNCPNCGEPLRSPLPDAGRRDTCPNCGAGFIVPGTEDLRRITAEKETKARHEQEAAEQRREIKLKEEKEKAAARARQIETEAQALQEQKEAAAARAFSENMGKQTKPSAPLDPVAGGCLLLAVLVGLFFLVVALTSKPITVEDQRRIHQQALEYEVQDEIDAQNRAIKDAIDKMEIRERLRNNR